ncbi:MAG: PH domain-containing protein [Candidatus Thorarchaeota archaeon]
MSSARPRDREKLVLLSRPKRIGRLIHYIVGVTVFLVGLMHNALAAAGFISGSYISVALGVSALVAGSIIVAINELRRKAVLYVITTWNVRIRRGIFSKYTRKLFYDQISRVEYRISKERRPAHIGDVLIFRKGVDDVPDIILEDVHSPEGLVEVIRKFMETTPTPPPWDHIPR